MGAEHKMKITAIDVHEIQLEYVDWIAYQLNHYYGPSRRTIYEVQTDEGLVGLGESGRTEPRDVIDQYIGTNPFDWMGDETSLGLGTAMYDLMGKAAGVPVYKLIGQKYRSWVPVGSWTVSTHPERMAEAVERYSRQGYTWLKYHLSPFENVFDQTEAMQKVAPPGFRIHYDFTMHGTDDHMPDLLERLSECEIAGCFEDPLPPGDIDGYIDLRERSRLPVVLHHFPLGATYEVFRKPADAYMLGHARIGDAIRKAGLFAAGNCPFMLQNVGGQHHEGDDGAHDGRLSDRHLPLLQRLRNLEERRHERTAGAGERVPESVGKPRSRSVPRPGGAGAPEGPPRCRGRRSGSSSRPSPTARACTTSPTRTTRFSWCGPTAAASFR